MGRRSTALLAGKAILLWVSHRDSGPTKDVGRALSVPVRYPYIMVVDTVRYSSEKKGRGTPNNAQPLSCDLFPALERGSLAC